MKLSHLFVILSLSHAGWSYAEIYKRVDSEGRVTYSSEPITGGKKLYLKPLATMPGARASGRSTPEDFPRVDNQTQKKRDDTRRVILEDELATEESQVEAARQNAKSLESNPEPLVGPDGIPFKKSGIHAEKLNAARDAVTLHEQNIKALETEISHLK